MALYKSEDIFRLEKYFAFENEELNIIRNFSFQKTTFFIELFLSYQSLPCFLEYFHSCTQSLVGPVAMAMILESPHGAVV